MNEFFKKFSDGVVLIFLGIILLLNTLGVVEWSIWLFYLNFWPLFLIFAGIRLLFFSWKKFEFIFTILNLFAILAVLILGLIFYKSFNFNWYNSKELIYNKSIEVTQLQKYDAVDYSFKFGFGDYTISDNYNFDDQLINVSGKYSENLGEPELNSELNTDNTITLDFGQQQSFMMMRPFFSVTNDFTLKLNPTIPSNVDLELGAGKATFNLSKIFVNDYVARLGAGEVNINLTNQAYILNFDVNVGAGKLLLNLPKDQQYNITSYHVGAGSLVINGTELGGLGISGQNIVSKDYNTNEPTIFITANIGAGQVIINNATE